MYDIIERDSKKRSLKDFLLGRMILSPPNWSCFSTPVPLAWSSVKFSPENMAKIPTTCGVYTFLVQPGIANHPYCSYLLYVGETTKQNFRARYKQYLEEQKAVGDARRIHVSDMLEKWDGYLHFCYAPIEKKELITKVENELLAAYLPPANRVFPAKIDHALKKVFAL